MQVRITKTKIDAMTAGQILADTEMKGFVARKLDSGAATYGYRYRDKTTGKQRWLGLGLHGSNVTADQARDLAKKAAGEVANKQDPVGELQENRAEAKREKLAAANTVNTVLDAFEKDHVDALRSGDQVKAAFENHVRPRLGIGRFTTLSGATSPTMLNEIEAGNGPVMADRVLAHVRKAFNWQMVQDDEFKSPIVRGMAKTKPKRDGPASGSWPMTRSGISGRRWISSRRRPAIRGTSNHSARHDPPQRVLQDAHGRVRTATSGPYQRQRYKEQAGSRHSDHAGIARVDLREARTGKPKFLVCVLHHGRPRSLQRLQQSQEES